MKEMTILDIPRLLRPVSVRPHPASALRLFELEVLVGTKIISRAIYYQYPSPSDVGRTPSSSLCWSSRSFFSFTLHTGSEYLYNRAASGGFSVSDFVQEEDEPVESPVSEKKADEELVQHTLEDVRALLDQEGPFSSRLIKIF